MPADEPCAIFSLCYSNVSNKAHFVVIGIGIACRLLILPRDFLKTTDLDRDCDTDSYSDSERCVIRAAC